MLVRTQKGLYMKGIKIRLLPIILLFGSWPLASYSCTTVFCNNKGHDYVVARTTDLYVSDKPRLVVSPRAISRTGESGENTLAWTSKYGNIAVTAFLSHAVTDGLNEKGLAVHLLYLSDTQYPTVDATKPTISNLLWAQYVLDNYSSVNEALEGTRNLQIVATQLENKMWPIHLTMEDSSGDSAVIEFIKGKMNVFHGPQYRVVTNEPAYDIQLANVKRYQGFGGKLSLPGDPDPLSRFVRASAFLKTLPMANSNLVALAGAFSVIRSVMVPFGAVDTSENQTVDAWATRWVSVADLTNTIYYFNATTAPNIIWVDLKKLDFTAGSPVRSIDPVDIHLVGDITTQLK